MSTKAQLTADVKEAMKAKDNTTRDTLRNILAAIRQVEVDQQKDLNEDDILKVLMTEAKKRRESIEAFEAGGRDEDAEAERTELSVIERYLPEQMSREELENVVKAAIEKVGAESPQDMGKVMGVVMPQVKGKADGKMVNEVARELLK